MLLILTVCAATCHDVAIPAPIPATPVGCLIAAQRTAAGWAELHPSQTVTAWRCEADR